MHFKLSGNLFAGMAARKLFLCLSIICLILFSQINVSYGIIRHAPTTKVEIRTEESNGSGEGLSADQERSQIQPSEEKSDYSAFAQLTGLLFLVIFLIFIWNRKLANLNNSLNAEVAQRRRMERVQEALNRIALAVTEVSGIDEFYAALQRLVNGLMFARNFYIASYDPKADALSFPYFKDDFKTAPAARRLGYGLTDYVIKTGRPLFADKAARNRLLAEGEFEIIDREPQCWIGVPLKYREETVGVIALQSYDGNNVLSRLDLETLVFLSSYVELALERLRLLEQGKKQTQDLRESEERFRSLFEDSADATVLLEKMRIIECNAAAYTLMGMSSKEELLGASPQEISPEYQSNGISSAELVPFFVEKAISQGGARFEWEALKKGGEAFPIEVLITPISYKGRDILHVVMRDITERKKEKPQL